MSDSYDVNDNKISVAGFSEPYHLYVPVIVDCNMPDKDRSANCPVERALKQNGIKYTTQQCIWDTNNVRMVCLPKSRGDFLENAVYKFCTKCSYNPGR